MKYNIIIIAAEPWENYTWRRRHHVAWALAKNNRVLFVEPPYSLFSPFKNKYISWRQLLNMGRLKHRGRNLYSYSPLKLIPLTILPSANIEKINKKAIFCQVRKAVKKLDMKKPILWTYFCLDQYEYYGVFGEMLTITDCYDKFTTSFGFERTQDYQMKICELQNKLLERADIAFATSKELYEDIKKIKPVSYYIPHGVDVDMYLKNDKPHHRVFKHLEKIRKPILGYLGSIQHKIDFELLRYIAASHPEWSLVLVGKTAINNATDMSAWNELKEMENVHYFKEVERECIPSILNHFNICMLPFKKIEWQHYAANLKIWEYLAAGKPMLAINQCADYTCNDLMYVVDNKFAFEKAVERILSSGENGSLFEERREFAMKNSWDIRIQQMLTIIKVFLAKKNQ